MKGLLGLGIFGGMIPCPSAIVVMLMQKWFVKGLVDTEK